MIKMKSWIAKTDMHQLQAMSSLRPILANAKKHVHHTNIGLDKTEVRIRKLAPYSQNSLAHEQTKDIGVVVWVAHMKPFWIVSVSACIRAGVHLAAAALYHYAVWQLI
jgi:hypothetical protein